MGITIAMDDYGTGFSSIDALSQWPFSVVKIDQGLIQRMTESEKSTTIVQASLRMAHQLGIDVVAEGIETAEAYDFLLRHGCTDAQGFWLGKPMPLVEFLQFITQDQRWSGVPVGLIHMAILDHIQWRHTLISEVMAIHNGTAREIRVSEAELDHHNCKLGKWYYGSGQRFINNPYFRNLEEPHRQLHQVGHELYHDVKNGASKSIIEQHLRELTNHSLKVLEILHHLEHSALMSKNSDDDKTH